MQKMYLWYFYFLYVILFDFCKVPLSVQILEKIFTSKISLLLLILLWFRYNCSCLKFGKVDIGRYGEVSKR